MFPAAIRIVFIVGYEAGVPNGGTVPSDHLADYTFDPLADWSSGETTLPVQSLPPLVISLDYRARTESVGLLVGQSGRDLCWLSNFVLAVHGLLRVRLSPDTLLDVHFNRLPPVTRIV